VSVSSLVQYCRILIDVSENGLIRWNTVHFMGINFRRSTPVTGMRGDVELTFQVVTTREAILVLRIYDVRMQEEELLFIWYRRTLILYMCVRCSTIRRVDAPYGTGVYGVIGAGLEPDMDWPEHTVMLVSGLPDLTLTLVSVLG
jgi:hypothetical protein